MMSRISIILTRFGAMCLGSLIEYPPLKMSLFYQLISWIATFANMLRSMITISMRGGFELFKSVKIKYFLGFNQIKKA